MHLARSQVRVRRLLSFVALGIGGILTVFPSTAGAAPIDVTFEVTGGSFGYGDDDVAFPDDLVAEITGTWDEDTGDFDAAFISPDIELRLPGVGGGEIVFTVLGTAQLDDPLGFTGTVPGSVEGSLAVSVNSTRVPLTGGLEVSCTMVGTIDLTATLTEVAGGVEIELTGDEIELPLADWGPSDSTCDTLFLEAAAGWPASDGAIVITGFMAVEPEPDTDGEPTGPPTSAQPPTTDVLPATGGDSRPMTAVALAIVLIGAGALVVSRRAIMD